MWHTSFRIKYLIFFKKKIVINTNTNYYWLTILTVEGPPMHFCSSTGIKIPCSLVEEMWMNYWILMQVTDVPKLGKVAFCKVFNKSGSGSLSQLLHVYIYLFIYWIQLSSQNDRLNLREREREREREFNKSRM